MNKLNLLSRAEMKKVMGGIAALSDVCDMLITYADGSTKYTVSFWEGEGSGGSNARSECAQYISRGARKCQYDCGSDGFTASWRPNNS